MPDTTENKLEFENEDQRNLIAKFMNGFNHSDKVYKITKVNSQSIRLQALGDSNNNFNIKKANFTINFPTFANYDYHKYDQIMQKLETYKSQLNVGDYLIDQRIITGWKHRYFKLCKTKPESPDFNFAKIEPYEDDVSNWTFLTTKELVQPNDNKFWFNWCSMHWGTKWNAFDVVKTGKFMIEFSTAWNGIPELMNKLHHMFPKIPFTYSWLNESETEPIDDFHYIDHWHLIEFNQSKLENSPSIIDVDKEYIDEENIYLE